MRSFVIILGGLVLLGGLHLFRRLASEGAPGPAAIAMGFLAIWLAVTICNLISRLRQGYGFAEELPIQALVFGVPALAALLAHRLADRPTSGNPT
jgi:hypothetical protein